MWRHLVERDDVLRARLPGRREHVPIIRIGKDDAIEEQFVAGDVRPALHREMAQPSLQYGARDMGGTVPPSDREASSSSAMTPCRARDAATSQGAGRVEPSLSLSLRGERRSPMPAASLRAPVVINI